MNTQSCTSRAESPSGNSAAQRATEDRYVCFDKKSYSSFQCIEQALKQMEDARQIFKELAEDLKIKDYKNLKI